MFHVRIQLAAAMSVLVIVAAQAHGAAEENAYVRRNLVVNRDDPGDPTSPPPAPLSDPLLVNPWGAAVRPAGLGGHFWPANAAVFDQRGQHICTSEGRGRLNAPWGMAIAPANLGAFGRALLVSDFGDGTVVAFDLATGKQRDDPRHPSGHVIQIDGLWAIFFGNGASLGRRDFLYRTAGLHGETDGAFGSPHYIGIPNPDVAVGP
jgi:hypothetical protein